MNKDAWTEKTPKRLVTQCLDAEADNKRIVYIGAKPTEKGDEQNIYDGRIRQSFDLNSGKVGGINKSREFQKEHERARADRFKVFNEETAMHKQIDAMKKECLSHMIHMQTSIEDAIHKSKKIMENYEENFKGEGAYGHDQSDDEHQQLVPQKKIHKNATIAVMRQATDKGLSQKLTEQQVGMKKRITSAINRGGRNSSFIEANKNLMQVCS